MKISSFTPVARSLSVLVLGLATGLPAIAQYTPAPAPAAAPAAAQVQVTTPKRGEIHRFITLPGTLRANQQVTLHAKVAGYLKAITVDKGDKVKAGQLLAEIEMPELVAERAKHEAELNIAKVESGRLN